VRWKCCWRFRHPDCARFNPPSILTTRYGRTEAGCRH
jgi:hypothetical protein